MSEQDTQVFYEIHLTHPTYIDGGPETELTTWSYGPYATPHHVKLALKNNRHLRYWLRKEGSSMVVKKTTRVYTDTVEEVEI